MNIKTKTSKIAIYGVLTALAIILSYVEMQLPAFFAIPGIKPGLTNIVVVVALYSLGNKSSLFINFVRIAIVSMLFGTLMAFLFSAVGGILSTTVMIILKKTGKFNLCYNLIVALRAFFRSIMPICARLIFIFFFINAFRCIR